MDIIFFDPESGINSCFYRKHNQHAFKTGENHVAKIVLDKYPLILPHRPMQIENMTGKFNDFLRVNDILPLMSKNKLHHHQMFHVMGTLTILKKVVYFKGCKGLQNLQNIARDIGLIDMSGTVYMVLLSGNLGIPVDVRIGCFLESQFVLDTGHAFVSRKRMFELHTTLFFDMVSWNSDLFPRFPNNHHPTKIFMTVSNKGCIILRMSFARQIWTLEQETACLRFGNMIMQIIQAKC